MGRHGRGTALTLVGASERHAGLQARIDAAEVAEQRLHLFARGGGLVGDPAAPRRVRDGHRGTQRHGGRRKNPPSPHPSGGASQGWCNGPRLPGIPKDHNPVCPTETPWGPRTPHRDTMNDTRTPRPTQETPSPHRNTLLYTGTSLPGVPHRTSCTTEGPLPRPLGTHCDPSGPQASHGDPLHPIRRAPCTTQGPPEPPQNALCTPPPPRYPLHRIRTPCTALPSPHWRPLALPGDPTRSTGPPSTPGYPHSLQLHRLHQLVQLQDLILQLVVQGCVLHDEQIQLLGGEGGQGPAGGGCGEGRAAPTLMTFPALSSSCSSPL